MKIKKISRKELGFLAACLVLLLTGVGLGLSGYKLVSLTILGISVPVLLLLFFWRE